MATKSFGEFLKRRRMATRLTLRAFCQAHGFDPSNFSKMERGLLRPPHGEKLEEYAAALGLARESDDWFEFHDLASVAQGEIPDHLLSDEQILDKLPVLFRALREIDPDKLDTLPDLIRRS